MQIFIETPTWLGDSVMITPSIENIIARYPQVEITFFGSQVATSIFKNHPNLKQIIIDKTRVGNRAINTFKIAKSLGRFDYALSYRSSFFSKVLLFFIKAKYKKIYKREGVERHQVIRYNDFFNKVFKLNTTPKNLKIYTQNTEQKQNILGINPGATYGSAKRYYPDKFAEVINSVANKFDKVIIFGGPNEKDIAIDIVKNLTIKNYENLAGKLSIEELIDTIAGLKIFITADSGPMHIAASFNIQTIALFGPTKDNETSPWSNNYTIIKQDLEKLDCTPCMQRECSLKHHKCMKNITPEQIYNVIN